MIASCNQCDAPESSLAVSWQWLSSAPDTALCLLLQIQSFYIESAKEVSILIAISANDFQCKKVKNKLLLAVITMVSQYKIRCKSKYLILPSLPVLVDQKKSHVYGSSLIVDKWWYFLISMMPLDSCL